jgi:purine-binding chemotaxis protein CheW
VIVERAGGAGKALIVAVQNRVCAVPLQHVIETMRPLSIEMIADLPPFVLGVAIVRGIPTPVVDLGAVLGLSGHSAAERFVTVRAGDKQIALSVSAVLGIRNFQELSAAQELPPLLQGSAGNVIETMGTLDGQLLMVLQAAWKLPDEIWEAMTAQEAVA